MEVNGKDDLKSPLLQHPNDVVITVSPPNQTSHKKIRTLVFKVVGITCSSCVASIEAALGELDGVQSVAVSVLQGQAVVKYVPEVISVSKIQFFLLFFITLWFKTCATLYHSSLFGRH